jgi:hypothetical protein
MLAWLTGFRRMMPSTFLRIERNHNNIIIFKYLYTTHLHQILPFLVIIHRKNTVFLKFN